MARIAVDDGVRIVVCTPHIKPGVYNNAGPDIYRAVAALQGQLDRAQIGVVLTAGADVHIAPDLVEGLKCGRVLPLGRSRYFLLEPPQNSLPAGFEEFLISLLGTGYVPIITHPERLLWVESRYDLLRRLVGYGALIQLTAGSLVGRFGRSALNFAERIVDDGLAHLIASDAHNAERRKPGLSEAFNAVALRLGRQEAVHMVVTRPAGILRNLNPDELPPTVGVESSARPARRYHRLG